jgi:phage terminase small subunit
MGKGFNITRERIIQELALIAFGDTKNLFDEAGNLKKPGEWENEGRVVSSYEESVTEFGDDERGGTKTTKKVKQWEKTKALDSLAKMLGVAGAEKHELNGLLQIQQITGMTVT